jgi:hypothetical protein
MGLEDRDYFHEDRARRIAESERVRKPAPAAAPRPEPVRKPAPRLDRSGDWVPLLTIVVYLAIAVAALFWLFVRWRS